MPEEEKLVVVDESALEDIAEAIRTKLHNTELYAPADMNEAILSIKAGAEFKTFNVKVNQKPNQTIRVHYSIGTPPPATDSLSVTEEICKYNYSVKVETKAGVKPGELTVLKNGSNVPIDGLLDGDLEISITDAIDTRFDIRERYKGREKFTPEDIAEMTNPNLIAKDDASNAFSQVKDTNFPKIMIDVSGVTNMNGMFGICSATSLDLTNFNTSSVTNMQNMFARCSNLVSLNVSTFDTSNVTSMRRMFGSIPSIKSLDLSHFDTSNVTDMAYMFYGCYKLEVLDISKFNTEKATTISSMLHNLKVIKYIIIDNSSITFNMNRTRFKIPADCKILVPKDSLDAYKKSSYFSTYASQLDAIENYNIIRAGDSTIEVKAK